ncbi:emp24p/erv25p-related protein [Exophiala xenobiotica]|uniref:Emp24p/erv25p-related protein n=1 Tax=Lithohypha guttulata TaxID=1690604 RepID=A0ABR0KAW5_9EURO|nr:emp24p/erv25p-related protein [Lithohypha guttulata]KAK5318005.1 emp24p/erv25p-related protein [Exophiala xenobiotica]
MLLASILTAICLLASSTQALYFYIDGTTPKCFYEELPKDTLVVGYYKAEAYNTNSNTYQTTNDLAIQVTVDETFDNDHRVVSQTSTSSDKMSKFTFSAADSGLHRLCFTPSGPGAVSLQGWFSGNDAALGGVKLMLDLAIGESSKIESDDKNKIDSIVGKVRELNGRLADVRREQVFQREREAEFRDQSESVNARIVKWTLIQLFVLGATCAWQLSHLRSFFIKQKLT